MKLRRLFLKQSVKTKPKKNGHCFSAGKMLLTLFLAVLLLGALPLSAQTLKPRCITFDKLRLGTYQVGDVFIDSGVKIKVERFIGLRRMLRLRGGGTAKIVRKNLLSNRRTRLLARRAKGNEVFLDRAGLSFKFRGRQDGLRMQFRQPQKGNINININGTFKNVSDISRLNGTTIGRVRVTVLKGRLAQTGTLVLKGKIGKFMIGGYKLFLDNICPPLRMMPRTSIYFSDSTETRGSVYYYNGVTGIKSTIYKRPSGRLYSFVFAPWDRDRLYFVNANTSKIYSKTLSGGASSEKVVFNHTTYVRDIAFDSHNTLYFSEGTGGGGDGKIYRIEANGSATVFYNVRLSQVGGFWAGTFTFAPDDTLYLSSGNRVPSSLFKVDVAADSVTKVYDSPSTAIVGIAFGADDRLYFGTNKAQIYSLNTTTWSRRLVYQNNSHQIWDVGFRPKTPSAGPAGTWVMPDGIRGIRVDQINPTTGLINSYTDVGSGLVMDNAPFGGGLLFRLSSSNTIPTPAVYYYRYQYRRQGAAGWNDFDENISVHYVKNRPGKTPIFPTLKLGPVDVNGMYLYRFRPHQTELPSLVTLAAGETVEWPKIPKYGDLYRGYLDTVEEGLTPGKYEVRMDVYNSSGFKTAPGPAYQMIVPDGPTNTVPAAITDDGFQFLINVDNSKCNAEIEAPKIGTTTTDSCGFLRYNPASPSQVHFEWEASHPNGHARYYFNIIKGASGIGSLPLPAIPGNPTPSIPLPITDSVTSTANHGDGNGNFYQNSPTLRLLAGCIEAAYAIHVHVYAKATNGNGYRITQYDDYKIRAVAIAPQ